MVPKDGPTCAACSVARARRGRQSCSAGNCRPRNREDVNMLPRRAQHIDIHTTSALLVAPALFALSLTAGVGHTSVYRLSVVCLPSV
jgi:hypothetical protein